MKVALCEIKKNLQGTNSDRKETRTQINGLEHKEERNTQPEQNEETKIQENDLSGKEIANVSDGKFKTLVIRMLTEMTEFSHKIKEEMKANKVK